MSLRRCVSILCIVFTLPALATAQARPFPGPDVQQLYHRLLPQIEKIPAFDHHAHPGYADDPDVDARARPVGFERGELDDLDAVEAAAQGRDALRLETEDTIHVCNAPSPAATASCVPACGMPASRPCDRIVS